MTVLRKLRRIGSEEARLLPELGEIIEQFTLCSLSLALGGSLGLEMLVLSGTGGPGTCLNPAGFGVL